MSTAIEETIISTSKAKLVLIALGSTPLATAGVYLFLLSPDWIETERWYASVALIHGFGLVSFFLFGLCSMFAIRTLLERGPGLSLNSAGLRDHSGAIATELIPWKEIVGFEFATIRGKQALVVRLTNPETYVCRGGPLRRITSRANLSLCGSPIMIATGPLNLELDELEDLCRHYLEHYGKAGDNPSEPRSLSN